MSLEYVRQRGPKEADAQKETNAWKKADARKEGRQAGRKEGRISSPHPWIVPTADWATQVPPRSGRHKHSKRLLGGSEPEDIEILNHIESSWHNPWMNLKFLIDTYISI